MMSPCRDRGMLWRQLRNAPGLFWVVLAVAAVLRFGGAAGQGLLYDESAHLACAETIDFRLESFRLVWRSVDHPALSVYLVRLSGLLFGDSDFGIRVIHCLAGLGTVALVFFLGRSLFSERVGLWAAALLAVDRFHVRWSYFIVPEVLLLLFSVIAILIYFRFGRSGATRDAVLLGGALGFAYVSKETAVILFPILWIHMGP